MKKTFKKITSVILAATVGVLSSAAVIPAYAAEEFDIVAIETDTSSEYGYQNYRYVDENGNEVVFENEEKLFTQSSLMLPSSYDARDYGYITDVKTQGYAGNCWAYASLSALETSSIVKGIKTAETADFSEAHLTWFAGRGLAQDTNDSAYGDGYNAADPFRYGGNWKRSAAALARWTGAANENEFPSYPFNLSAMGNYDESDRYVTSAGVVIESAQKLESAADIKEWIMENGSATISYYSDDDMFFDFKTNAYYCPEKYTTNHMVTIVGWDDGYSAENFGIAPPADGAWICKNSWGASWGDGGYFMISYYDASLGEASGFTARSTEGCYKNYTYNGVENSAYMSGSLVKVANVFKCAGNEKLDALGIQTIGSGTKVTIRIYKNIPKNYKTPEAGTLVETKEILLDNEGYHTVYLDDEISLGAGEIFAVAVEYKNTGSGDVYVPVEMSGRTPSFSCKQGESYLYYNKSVGYIDVSMYYSNVHNFYIQAFTKCNHQTVTKTEGLTCTSDGTEIICCSQCGKVESEQTVYHRGHNFSGWSSFEENHNGEEISKRICYGCGLTETKTTYDVRFVTMNNLLDMILSRFRIIFGSLFSK